MNLLNHTSSLVAFVRAVESGSFSAAARLSGMTPSAVSKGIRRLEAELKVKLFRRSTRQVNLTAEGSSLFERVAPLLRGLEDSAAALTGEVSTTGVLRASVPSELGRLLLPRIATAFLPQHPGLEVDLSLTDHQVDIVRDGFDVVLRVGWLEDSGLRARTLAHLPMALVATPSLLARHGAPATRDDLASMPFVRYVMRGRALPVLFDDGSSFIPSGPLGADTGAALRMGALHGAGVAYLLKCTVQGDLDCGSLVEIPGPISLPALPLQALHAFDALPPARVKRFTDFVAAEVALFS
jgi:DNA-binding transcriptional LysR family regulator